MTQINLIQDTVMILDEVHQMDASQEQIISYNLKKIEKHLEILDEIERSTAIATTRVNVLFEKIRKVEVSRALPQKPLNVTQHLDKMNIQREVMEQSLSGEVIDSIKKSPINVDTIPANIENAQMLEYKVSEKVSTMAKTKKSTTDANLENVCKELCKIEKQLELLEGIKSATNLEVEHSDRILSLVGGAGKNMSPQKITITERGSLPVDICDAKDLSAALSKVEKRLTDLEELQRAIGVQSDVVE